MHVSLFQCLGSPRLVSQTHLHKKILSAIPEGTSQDENYIFHRDKEVVNCFSRICDHNRGRLTLNGQKAVCPLHGWIFDPKEGAYDNVQISKSKEEILVSLDKDLLTVEKIEGFLEYPNYKPKNTRIEVSFYSHACLLFSSNEFRFAIDPWIVGPAFVSGWWPSHTPVEGWKNDINSSDFIYISHNHPDHLNASTLACIRKDMPFIVPKFKSNSVQTSLQNLGYDNIIPLECGMIYNLSGTSLILSLLESGDKRDDSGIYFNYGDFSYLSSVDSNDLNSGILPFAPTLMSTCASPGSSGYPLCFNHITEVEKKKIMKRTKSALLSYHHDLIKSVQPSYFMPYACFFEARAQMDSYIKENNISSSADDYQPINCKEVLDVNQSDIYTFDGQSLQSRSKAKRERHLEDSEEWINSNLDILKVPTFKQIRTYFEKAEFHDELILYLTLCDNDFLSEYSTYKIDFTNSSCNELKLDNHFPWDKIVKSSSQNQRLLWVRVRAKAFAYVLINGLPWEDLSIGFQCRINRHPNVYNSKFWNHFTNHHIGKDAKVA